MPENSRPIWEMFPTLRQQFWAAENARPVVLHMLKEPEPSWKFAFEDEQINNRFKLILKNKEPGSFRHFNPFDPSGIANWIATPILSAFLEKTYPVDQPRQRKISVMDWIIRRYLAETHNGRQIMAEDLYKIGEDIRYFNRLQAGGHIKNKTVEEHQDLAALQETLQPFDDIRQKKKIARVERHMGSGAKNEILAGTTIIHEGTAGRIVMVHTIPASQYWGNNTRWCISGEKTAKIDFPNYSRKPILMLLPGGEKHALVGKEFYDSKDATVKQLPPPAQSLLDQARSHLPANIIAAIDALLPAPKTEPVFGHVVEMPIDQDMSEHERRWVKSIRRMDGNIENRRVPDDIASNRKIMMAAIDMDPIALKLASAELKNDKDLVLHAVTKKGTALKYASHELCWDKDIVMAAVQNEGHALSYAGEALRSDKEIVTAAITRDGSALINANADLREDKNMVALAVKGDPSVLIIGDTIFSRWMFDKDIIRIAAKYHGEVGLDRGASHLVHDPDYFRELMDLPAIALDVHRLKDNYPAARLFDEKEIALYQAKAIRTLIAEDQHDKAAESLQRIRPLWGRADLIFGAPEDAAAWLETHISPTPSQSPAISAPIPRAT